MFYQRLRHLVSQLFDVDIDSKLSDEPLQDSECIRIPWGKGIVGYVAEFGESVNIPDCYMVSRVAVNVFSIATTEREIFTND